MYAKMALLSLIPEQSTTHVSPPFSFSLGIISGSTRWLVGIISGSIWGHFRVGDHFGGCTDFRTATAPGSEVLFPLEVLHLARRRLGHADLKRLVFTVCRKHEQIRVFCPLVMLILVLFRAFWFSSWIFTWTASGIKRILFIVFLKR